MTTILLDIDGVICAFAETYLAILREQTGKSFNVSDVTNFDFTRCVSTRDEDRQVWNNLSNVTGLIANLAGHWDNLIALDRLRENHRVVAVTTPRWHCPKWMPERTAWLVKRGFATSDIVFVGDKSLVVGDILIDDGPHNITAWSAAHPFGRAILLERPWNTSFAWEDRIDSLDSVL